MIVNNAAELLPFEMDGRSSTTLIFIILVLKFNNQVGQLPTHVETHLWAKCNLILWEHKIIHNDQIIQYRVKCFWVDTVWCMVKCLGITGWLCKRG